MFSIYVNVNKKLSIIYLINNDLAAVNFHVIKRLIKILH